MSSLIPVPFPQNLPPIPEGYAYIGKCKVDFTNTERFDGAFIHRGHWDKGMMGGATTLDDNTGKHYSIKDGSDTSMIIQTIKNPNMESSPPPAPDKMIEYPGLQKRSSGKEIIPMPPEGSICIGKGGQVPWETKFEGWVYRVERPEWGWQPLHNLSATMGSWFYAVPVDSKTYEFLKRKANTFSQWVAEEKARKGYKKILDYYEAIQPQEPNTLSTPFFTINFKSI